MIKMQYLTMTIKIMVNNYKIIELKEFKNNNRLVQIR